MKYSAHRVFIFQSTVFAAILAFSGLALGQEQNLKKLERLAFNSLKAEFGDSVEIKRFRATKKVNFVRLDSHLPGGLIRQESGMQANEKARSFLRAYGSIFGLQDPETELSQRFEKSDDLGGWLLKYDQYYNGIPVFGGVLIAHFDATGDLRSVNGTVAPYIKLDTKPEQSPETASAVAVSAVAAEFVKSFGISAEATALRIYRTGMAKGVAGENHLVWQITVGNHRDISQFVFVDAHSGEIVDQISGTYDALDRRIYDGGGILAFPPESYPSNPFWLEGAPFPSGDTRANDIIAGSGETYDFYKTVFGRDSFDGQGGRMVSFFNMGFIENAFQSFVGDQAFTEFGDEFTSDDVVAHEWTHAYTAYTDGLVYAWQPGALNESYSDIFGETIDQLNSRGSDSPGGRRSPNDEACSIFSTPIPIVRVNSPSTIVGNYTAASSIFGPAVPAGGISGSVVQVDDGVGIGSDGCSTPFVNADSIKGKIAMIDVTDTTPDGPCFASTKVLNAEQNGAVAVILANDSSLGNSVYSFSVEGEIISIPSVDVAKRTGDLIRQQPSNSVNLTILNGAARNSDNTYRWLFGEDDVAYGRREAIRDMWNPNCYLDAGRSTDIQYACHEVDSGGVHQNSGIPNHTFALLVDGGSYNGQTIKGIGLTKAAHIYYRAMTVYQTPYTDFADHAEALEASAQDLLGRNLPDLRTGLPSGQRISGNDLKQLHAATLATELRKAPTQCNFKPLLGKNPPEDSCGLSAAGQTTIFADSFETNPLVRWTATREVADSTTFQGGNWSWVHNLPDGRQGKGLFAYDFEGGCELPEPSQNGVLELASPAINIPAGLAGGPHLSFDHWVALEEGYDGGQLMISVNGGPFTLVDTSAFIYNGYNASLLPFPYSENVRGGQPAFTGADAGSIRGSWGKSIVDLSGYVHGGETIRLRFDMSTEFCAGTGTGWYLDNVRVYACNITGNR